MNFRSGTLKIQGKQPCMEFGGRNPQTVERMTLFKEIPSHISILIATPPQYCTIRPILLHFSFLSGPGDASLHFCPAGPPSLFARLLGTSPNTTPPPNQHSTDLLTKKVNRDILETFSSIPIELDRIIWFQEVRTCQSM